MVLAMSGDPKDVRRGGMEIVERDIKSNIASDHR